MADVVRVVRTVVLALVTPFLEKNPSKIVGLPVTGPVFSMARGIVAAFAVSEIYWFWHHGVHGWPEATLAIATVLALPVLNKIEQMKPEDVLSLEKVLLERFGVGAVAPVSAADVEPSKYDDHRADAPGAGEAREAA